MRALLAASVLAAVTSGAPAAAVTLRAMSFNIYGGGANDGKSIAETLDVLRAADADLIGLQETRVEGDVCTAASCPAGGPSVGPAIAEALGYYYHEQTDDNVALWANGILSRFPIVEAAQNDLGVRVNAEGKDVWLFNIHLDDEPYQPYQLLGIEYGPAPFIETEAEAIAYAQATRGPAMDLLFSAMAPAAGADAVFVTGDFNEPSGLDWTQAAADAGLHPLKVDWPTTGRLRDAGFVDAFRVANPDPVADPAFTWTPLGDEADPEDKHDRIDFLFARGAGLNVDAAMIVGETGPRTGLPVDPWPSDHRAVVAEFSLEPAPVPVPLPAGIWLLATAIAAVAACRFKFSQS